MSLESSAHIGVTGGVVARLRERILSNELAPGTRLNQATLADELGVSRIPVRDALHQLAAEGLVLLRGRAGATVVELSIADLEELYELREAVEPLASRLAAVNVGRAQLLRMAEWAQTMEHTSDPEVWARANHAFHALVYEQSGRPRMVALIANLRQQIDRYQRLHLAVPQRREQLVEEHRAIFQAASSRDPKAVEEATRAHLVTSHEIILAQLLDLQVGGDGRPPPDGDPGGDG
jgi:DNA-binding GntR family transcriptional regulator